MDSDLSKLYGAQTRSLNEQVRRNIEKTKDIVTANQSANTDNLIGVLNPIIRGWSNFYRHVISQEIFDKIDRAIWSMTLKWAKRRHPNKPSRWIKSKYFQRKGGRNWVFVEKHIELELLTMSNVHIHRHIKIRSDANPYDPHWKDYFDKRSKKPAAGCLAALYQCLSPVR